MNTKLDKHYACIENRPGEAKGMKKALLCDTLSAFSMVHPFKTECTDYEVSVR
jgi:hypothetical protein